MTEENKQDKSSFIKKSVEIIADFFDAKETIIALAAGVALGLSLGLGVSVFKEPTKEQCSSKANQELREWLSRPKSSGW